MPETAAQLERSLQLYRGLVEVSAAINSITDFEELLGATLDVAQHVMSAEASSLFLRDENGDLVLAVGRGPSGRLDSGRIVVPRGQGIAGWVLENGRSLLVPDAYQDPRFYPDADRQTGFRTRSILCAPLHRGRTEIGVLQVLNPREKEAFEEGDIEPFEAYANLAATAIEKLRSFQRLREQERTEQELSLAREIQRSFLPATLPSTSKLDFSAVYRPAHNIGGDFYDVQVFSEDECFFAIGDVSGKGIPAALMMAQAISMFRLILRPGIRPNEVLAEWNRRLHQHAFRGMFITAIVGRISIAEKQIELAGAGHHAPVKTPLTASAEKFPMTPPLGILTTIRPALHQTQLQDGERLVFFTDGLLESLNSDHQPFGEEGIARAVHSPFHSTRELVETLSRCEISHRGHAEAHDDLTILAFGLR